MNSSFFPKNLIMLNVSYFLKIQDSTVKGVQIVVNIATLD